MNYPIWQLDGWGGGLLIALIAIVHVYVSHFAVGGGLFLVLTERKALRDANQDLLDFVKKHTKFFLLLTMVFGGITGVGIWFTIALLNPAATSKLIHIFVFAWAMEWVFFVIEIVSLFIYYYRFGKMQDHHHQWIGWIYFGAAWMSLFIINGIIDFMLTPGAWVENNDFWSGFFNPSFWPALFFRTFMALLIAGLFGMVTASFCKKQELRTTLLRYSGAWLLGPLVLLMASAWWYKAALPADIATMIFREMPRMQTFLGGFATVSALLLLGGLLLAVRMPQTLSRPVTFVMLLLGLLQIGAFEFVREGGRKPYIIRDYMFSTSILEKNLAVIQEKGLLKQAKWVATRDITEDTRLAAGREVLDLLCLSCHSLGGPLNDIVPLTRPYTETGMTAFLSGMHIHNPSMPPFAGTRIEQEALAHYISRGIHGRSAAAPSGPPAATVPPAPPAFDPAQDTLVLLGWTSGGALCLNDGGASISLGLPPRFLQAQLIRRGEGPEMVQEGMELFYRLQGSNEEIPLPLGDAGAYQAALPASASQGQAQPQYAEIFTRDNNGSEQLTTLVAIPPSDRMGCYHCHGGELGGNGGPAFTTATADNILAAHDKISQTNLRSLVKKSGQVQCQQCHSDLPLSEESALGHLPLSAAIHAFHAVYFPDGGATACTICHGGDTGENSSCSGDIHHQVGLTCTNCHGTMEEHSTALLKGSGYPAEGALLARIGKSGADLNGVVARKPWVNQPDCLTCHVDFAQPENDSAVNSWTGEPDERFSQRSDTTGTLRCTACHGTIHRLLPVRDGQKHPANLQALQYQGNPLPIGSNKNCAVCHTMDMEDAPHHPNMERTFRNVP